MVVGGRYLLRRPIGQGGLGRVWRAQDQVLDRPVAVKEVLFPAGLTDGNMVGNMGGNTDGDTGGITGGNAGLAGRSMREALAAARVSHPGIVKIHDVVRHEPVDCHGLDRR
jgi:serine/threonine protein kinase